MFLKFFLRLSTSIDISTSTSLIHCNVLLITGTELEGDILVWREFEYLTLRRLYHNVHNVYTMTIDISYVHVSDNWKFDNPARWDTANFMTIDKSYVHVSVNWKFENPGRWDIAKPRLSSVSTQLSLSNKILPNPYPAKVNQARSGWLYNHSQINKK